MARIDRWVLLLATVALIAAACGGGGGSRSGTPAADSSESDEEVVAAEEVPTSTPGEDIEEPAAVEDEPDEDTAGTSSSDEMPEPSVQAAMRVDFRYNFFADRGAIQETLDQDSPVLLEPGTYTTDAMRTPMTFTTDQRWRLIIELPSFMALVDHERARGLWDVPFIQFNRPMAMVDPADTAMGPPDQPGAADEFDYDAWFDAHPELEVERSELEVGGISSIRYVISHPEGADIGWSCGPDVRCTPLSLLWDAGVFELVSAELFAFYVIPQGAGAPITAIAIGRDDDEWDDFVAEVDALISTVEFGPIVEPVFSERPWEDGVSGDVPGGPLWFPIGPGVAFETPQDLTAELRRNWSWLLLLDEDFTAFPPNVELAMAIETPEGVPFETAAQLADHLVERVSGAERLDDGELFGQPAVRVQMLGVRPNELMFRHVDTPDGADPGIAGWFTQDFVELWATETDEGVFILTAEAESEELLTAALELHTFVRERLEIESR